MGEPCDDEINAAEIRCPGIRALAAAVEASLVCIIMAAERTQVTIDAIFFILACWYILHRLVSKIHNLVRMARFLQILREKKVPN